MQKELAAAAKWWADQLRAPAVQDNGDRFQTAFASFAATKLPPLEPEMIRRFENEFISCIQEHYQRINAAWDRSNPTWGGYERVVGVDYDPHPVLYDAAERAGFSAHLRFPCKTVMQIGPGYVQVACGYRAPYVTLYKETTDGDD